MGLFEHPFAGDGEELHRIFDKTEGAELSLQSARESMILLKNNGVLPLSGKIRKLAVIGPHADCARKFFGGYTHLCMMESVYAVKSSIAGVEDSPESGRLDTEQAKGDAQTGQSGTSGGEVRSDSAVLPGGEPVEYVPGTQIQSDEAKLLRRYPASAETGVQESAGRTETADAGHRDSVCFTATRWQGRTKADLRKP